MKQACFLFTSQRNSNGRKIQIELAPAEWAAAAGEQFGVRDWMGQHQGV